MPGLEELLLITEKPTAEAAVEKCFENPNMEIVVLKNGSKGCTVYTRYEHFSMGVYPVNVVDTTGAGDSFDGAFICGLLENKDISTITKIATAAASLNTAAFGPMEGNISPETVNQMLRGSIV